MNNNPFLASYHNSPVKGARHGFTLIPTLSLKLIQFFTLIKGIFELTKPK